MFSFRGESEDTSKALPVLRGLLIAVVSMLVMALLLSILHMLTDIKENHLNVYAYSIHGLSVFFGGLSSGKLAGRKGWYYGAMTGLCYSLLILLIAFLGLDASLGSHAFTLLTIVFLSGAAGGMIGVNVRS